MTTESTEPTPTTPTTTPAPTMEDRVAALEDAIGRADGAVSLLLFLRANETIARALLPAKNRPEPAAQFQARLYHELAVLQQTGSVLGVVRDALAAQKMDTSVVTRVIDGYRDEVKKTERRLGLNAEPAKSIIEK